MWQWTSITVCPSVVEAQPNVEWRRRSHDANVPGPERPTPECASGLQTADALRSAGGLPSWRRGIASCA